MLGGAWNMGTGHSPFPLSPGTNGSRNWGVCEWWTCIRIWIPEEAIFGGMPTRGWTSGAKQRIRALLQEHSLMSNPPIPPSSTTPNHLSTAGQSAGSHGACSVNVTFCARGLSVVATVGKGALSSSWLKFSMV